MEFFVPRVLGLLAELVDLATGAAIGIGVIAAMVMMGRSVAFRHHTGPESGMPEVRITLGRWLALGLELALAADILRTAMIPTWDEIGKLGAIIVLRTVLNYFLQREIEQERQRSEYPLRSAA